MTNQISCQHNRHPSANSNQCTTRTHRADADYLASLDHFFNASIVPNKKCSFSYGSAASEEWVAGAEIISGEISVLLPFSAT